MVEQVQQDEIDAQQEAMDVEQGAEGTEPQFVPLSQFQEMQQKLERVLATQEQQGRHNQGLESRIDKGINQATRQAAEAAAMAAKLEREQTVTSLLSKVEDPDQREIFQQILAISAPPESAVPTAVEPAQPTPAQQNQWDGIFHMVRSLGVDPNDNRLDYQVLVDTTLPEQTRQDRFFASIRTAQTPTDPTPPAQQAPPRTGQTPPRSPGATGTGYRTADDVRGAYIEERIDKDEYRKRMAVFGESV